MSEKLTEKLFEVAGRRRFLRTLSGASAALALGVFSIRTANASIPCPPGLVKVGCCCLYKDPSTCTYGDCGCQWSWGCNETGPTGQRCGGARWTCKECYYNPPPPNSDCVNPVKCSDTSSVPFPPC